MKEFYLLRHEDVHNNSGTGVVAEGTIFDSGMCAMTWLSTHPTVTVFDKIVTVKELHGHDGKTEVVVEGKHDKFEECKKIARAYTTARKKELKAAKKH